ncbi:MAG TPA: hypothetical protein VFC39_22425 [Acidobacteriaceae bacterium]|nr:hypothetical protein [Acidobacteriaceae bacterium]
MNLRRVCPVVGLFFLAVIPTGCDPTTAIYKIFSDQGLTLVKPARSYIQIGGLVILPKGTNQLLYQDPWDVIDQAAGQNATPPSTDFSAVIMSQSDKSASGVDFKAVLAQLVSLPLGFDLSHNRSLTLGQIQANGTRYTTPMMAALVAKPNTATALRDRLNEGSRVFVIQEVYTGTSLSVTSGSGTNISASLGSGGPVPSCILPDSGSGTGGAAGKSGATGTTGTTGASGAKGATGATGAPGITVAAGSTGATIAIATGATGATGTSGATGASGATGKTGATAATIAGIGGMSAGVCFANAATLSFTSTTPVPFAVRLNEVTLVGGTTPAIKYTGYKLPNGALPASDPEVENSIAINSLADSSSLTPIPH